MENRYRTLWREAVPQRSTPVVAGTFVNFAGDPIAKADMNSATLRVWCDTTQQEIRAPFDILLYTDAEGNFAVPLVTDDTDIEGEGSDYETRVLQLRWRWGVGGAYEGYHEIAFHVKNLVLVGTL